jgi:hypothetical protein
MQRLHRSLVALGTTLALAAASAASAQTAAPLQVASLGPVSGKVMINKGKGFVAARPGIALAPGDRVIALNGSTAAIVYPNGCVAEMRENSLLAVDARTQCSTRPVATGATAPLRVAQAIGGTAVDAGAQAKDDDCSEEARKRRAAQRRAAGLPEKDENDRCPPLVFWTSSNIIGVAGFAAYSAFVIDRSRDDDKPISAR